MCKTRFIFTEISTSTSTVHGYMVTKKNKQKKQKCISFVDRHYVRHNFNSTKLSEQTDFKIKNN